MPKIEEVVFIFVGVMELGKRGWDRPLTVRHSLGGAAFVTLDSTVYDGIGRVVIARDGTAEQVTHYYPVALRRLFLAMAIGEFIAHSAIVFQVDKEGYTTEVISKMGQLGISRNHPRAPGFYVTHKRQKTSRAYFRETKKWLLYSNRRSLSSPKFNHVEKPDALYVAPKTHQ